MNAGGWLRLADRPVRLAGEDLVLRQWSATDLDAMVELFHEPAIAYRTPLPSPFTLADAQRRLERARDGDVLLLAVTVDGERPLGEVMVTPESHLAYVVEQQYGAPHRDEFSGGATGTRT